MRIYNNFNLSNLKTYFKEIQYKADSLATYRDLHNPNYIVINKTNGFTAYDLIQSGLLKIVLDVTNANDLQYFYVIKPNLLKMHRGIINTYGSKVKLYFDRWNFPSINFTDIDEKIRVEISNTLGISKNADIPAYTYSATQVRGFELAWDDNEEWKYQSFKVVYDPSTDPAISANIEVYDQDGNLADYSKYTFYDFPQGNIIFCDSIEEDEPVEKNSNLRRNAANYILIPATAASGYYTPSSTVTNGQVWSYVDKGTDSMGTSAFINIDFRQLRYTYNQGDLTFISSGDVPALTFEAYHTENNKYVFDIHSIAVSADGETSSSTSGTLWTGMNTNLLFHKVIGYNQTSSNTIIEEEIFADDTINYGSRNVDSISKPYYTVIIKHEADFPKDYIHARLW